MKKVLDFDFCFSIEKQNFTAITSKMSDHVKMVTPRQCAQYQQYKDITLQIAHDQNLSFIKRFQANLLYRSLEKWYDHKCVNNSSKLL